MMYSINLHNAYRLIATIFILICLLFNLTTSLAANPKAQIRWTGLGVEIAGDVNRDGLINVHPDFTDDNGVQVKSDMTQEPYLIWINDDDDYSNKETDGHDIPNSFVKDGLFIGTYDHNSSGIDGTRDLIDFFPVGINLHTLLQGFDTNPSFLDSFIGSETKFASNNYEFLLRQGDEAVNVIFTAMTMDQANAYLINTKIVGDQKEELLGDWHEIFGNDLDDILTEQVTTKGLEIPEEFIQHVKESEDSGVILLEGVQASDKPLQLILKNKHTDKETPLGQIALSVNSVTDFYRYVNLRGVETGGAVPAIPPSPTALQDSMTNGKHMFAMHGYNVSEEAALGWAAETFKRMWQSGSNAMFTFVSWNGNEGQLLDVATPNYWINVVNAFRTSSYLSQVVNSDDFQGQKKSIMAHSLGNMVVSDAIQNHGMQVDNYFMTDAAVAMEAYDEAKILEASILAMKNPAWLQYLDPVCNAYSCANDTSIPVKPNNRWLWPTEWYQYFDANDPRNKLTWRSAFNDVHTLTNVINFYSSTEDVLENGDGQGTSLGAVTTATSGGLNAWYQQEIAKGTDLYLTAIAAGLLTSGEDSYGGWGINTIDYSQNLVLDFDYEVFGIYFIFPHLEIRPMLPEIAFNLNTHDIRLTPFFGNFKDEYQFLYNESVSAIEPEILSNILAHAMPALSFAAGRNKFSTVDGDGFADYNMSELINTTSWPRESLTWKHSDIKAIGYLYTYEVFDEYVRRGRLR